MTSYTFAQGQGTIERQRHPPGEATIPPLPEHMLTIHLGQSYTALHRRNGQVYQERIIKGHLALTPANQPHGWRQWDKECDVLLVGLKPELLSHVACATSDVEPNQVELLTNFSFRDTQIERIGQLLWSERQSPGAASQLYIESLTNILAVHLLRHYCTFKQIAPELAQGFLGSVSEMWLDELDD